MAEKINNYENTNRLFDKAADALDLGEDERIDAEALALILPGLEPEKIPGKKAAAPAAAPAAEGELPRLEDFDRQWQEAERDYLLQLVEKAAWNLSAAGRLADVRNRNTLVSRLRKHGIQRPGKEK